MTKASKGRTWRKVFGAKPGEEEVVVPISHGPGSEEMVVGPRGAFKRPTQSKPGDMFMPDVFKMTLTGLLSKEPSIHIENESGSWVSDIPYDEARFGTLFSYNGVPHDIVYVIATPLPPDKFAIEKRILGPNW